MTEIVTFVDPIPSEPTTEESFSDDEIFALEEILDYVTHTWGYDFSDIGASALGKLSSMMTATKRAIEDRS